MKFERVKLSKPYPFMKFCKDGEDLVFSFLSFYLRIGDIIKTNERGAK